MRSAHASGPEGRDLRTDAKTVKPPSHSLRWRGFLGAADDIVAKLLPGCWPVWYEKRAHHLSGAEFLAWIMGSATQDWPGQADNVSLLHTVFYKWRVLHLRKIIFSRWFQQTLVLLKKHSSKIPCPGVESHPAIKSNPARNFWSWSLFMSEWSTVVWVGTCYLLIPIFGHFIFVKMYRQ